jgi:predicted RNA-binding Zn-ribbon protein involved in translation (DUF1610 family)
MIDEKAAFQHCYCLNADGTVRDVEDIPDYELDEEEGEGYYGGVPWHDGVDRGFSDAGGVSALRAATHDFCPRHGCHRAIDETDSYCRSCGQQLNPRKFACPTCGTPDVLTAADVQRRYQCDGCADRVERGVDY